MPPGRSTRLASVTAADGIGEVLQHLVGVDDVERGVGHVEVVGVADRELGAARRRSRVAWAMTSAEASTPSTRPGATAAGEVDRDRARAAPEVEQVHARAQVRQQVAGRVLGRAPGVAAQHRLVMTVGVDVAHEQEPRGPVSDRSRVRDDGCVSARGCAVAAIVRRSTLARARVQLSKPRPKRSRVRSHALRLPVRVLAVQRPAGRLDADEAERLGRERQRLVLDEVGRRGHAAAAVDAGRASPRRRSASTPRRGRCSRARSRPGPAIAVPQNTQNRLHVSIAPPQMWLKRTPSSCGNVVEEVLAQLGPRLRPALELGGRPCRASSRWRRSRPTGSGCPRSVGSSGTGWGCPTGPGGCAQPIDASCSAVSGSVTMQ